MRLSREGFSQFKQGRYAGRVVHSAIIDLVFVEVLSGGAGFLACFLPKVIPVGGVEHVLVRRRGAGQDADHIAAVELVDGLDDFARGLEPG